MLTGWRREIETSVLSTPSHRERRRHSRTRRLQRDDGSWAEGANQLKELITNYSSTLFTSSVGFENGALLQNVQAKVTPQMKEALRVEFPAAGVEAAFSGGVRNRKRGAEVRVKLYYTRDQIVRV